MAEKRTAADVWRLYEKGRDYQNKIDLVERTDKAHRFYLGDQWYGMQSGGEELPVFNFIKPIVKYKVATVAQNTMSAVYSPIDNRDPAYIQACELLNKHFAKKWERAKMDSLSWKLIKDACIQGDAYLYFGEGDDVTAAQLIDNVNIFLADERDPDIQDQKYIIIRERRFVEDVRREAEENGVLQDQIDLILSDEANQEQQLGEKQEQSWDTDKGKCTCLLYLHKGEDGIVHCLKAVQNVIYQPDAPIQATDAAGNPMELGLRSYPLVNFLWEDKKGSGRGAGEVEFLIPNQLEVNKTLARRAIAVKQSAFPKLAYVQNAVLNPDELDLVGGKIAVKNVSAQNINAMVSYLNPAMLSPDAKNLSDELIMQSRELAGAGDAATGSIDPTQASGTAIIAVRDQTALPLNEQLSRYQQFVEDLAYLWYDLWTAYNPNGIEVEVEPEQQPGRNRTARQEMSGAAPQTGPNQAMGRMPIDQTTGQPDAMPGIGSTSRGPEIEVIPREVLEKMKVNVRVDVSQNNPFSKFAQEQSLERLFQMQAITFEEYVEALNDDAAVPKGKLEDILTKRAARQAEQMQQQMQQLAAQNEQLAAQNEQLKQEMAQQQMQGAGMEPQLPQMFNPMEMRY